jgi:sporulation protein YlmC with PRC-barrel domain
MRLSDLLGLDVVGSGGWRYGRVHDVRINDDDVVSLVIGPSGLKERMFGRGDGSDHPNRRGRRFEIPWHEVTEITKKRITIEERR